MAVLHPKQLQIVNFSITTICLIGFSLSFYSLLVEINLEHDPNYKAMCDISEHMSCTKAFGSGYGKGFGIIGKLFGEKSALNQPNSLYGMVYYTLYFLINLMNFPFAVKMNFALSILSSIVTLYLAAILAFILKDFCIVCVSTYFVNLALLCLVMCKVNIINTGKSDKTDKKQS